MKEEAHAWVVEVRGGYPKDWVPTAVAPTRDHANALKRHYSKGAGVAEARVRKYVRAP